ncbi:Peptidyl-prolyl cis-trans isomerase [Actinidia chinensis var. chinensis]|uniref:peptidylprolyl isomerase n=1 Tax=Actinidia chinensis var. chinensis TaxID=1590841 RepID=A0A2R6PBR7_ACTCC|nr:Peptidyl-prolyl cis-trans isomerase [Actinidia chinensis var. chinensis]
MAFWGVLVKPGTPYTLQHDGAPKRLRISQATLGEGSWYSKSRSIVRCSVGSKPPVYICALSIKDVYSHQLDLEFEESEDIVFSVSGVRGVYLTGYYLNSNPNTAITTTTGSDDPHKPLLRGLEDIEEANNELPSHNSEGNKRALNHGLIDDCTVNFLPTLDEPPSIEGIVELTDGKEMDSGDFDVHKVVNNVVTEQETKSSDLQKEEMIDEKTERIVYQISISTMPNTSLPPGNVCKLKEKKSEESMIHDTIPKCNQDKVVDYSDCETLKDQGYVSASWTSDEPHCALAPSAVDGLQHVQKEQNKGKERSKEFKIMECDVRNTLDKMPSESDVNIVAMDQDPRFSCATVGDVSTRGHSHLKKRKKKANCDLDNDKRTCHNQLDKCMEQDPDDSLPDYSQCIPNERKNAMSCSQLSAFIQQVQEVVVPSIETGYSKELKKTKQQQQGNGRKNSQIKNEVTAHAVKEKQAGDVDDNQCVIYAINDSARSDNNRIHSDGLVENPIHNNRSSTADNQVQDVVELSKVFEARHSNKPKKKKVKELKNPLTEKSATILNKCMQNQAEYKDGGQCGNSDRNECARYKTTNVIANERANVPDDDQSNTADHQVQDVSVLSMVFEAGHSNKPKKKKRKGLENPLTEKSATILNKYMENQVEDEDGGHCGNYDHTECARYKTTNVIANEPAKYDDRERADTSIAAVKSHSVSKKTKPAKTKQDGDKKRCGWNGT